MEFRGEVDGLNAGALKIAGQGMKFAARIGQMAFGNFSDDDAAAFGADFHAAEVGSDTEQGVVSGIETVENTGMRGLIQTMSAKEEVKFAEGADGLVLQRVGMRQLGFARDEEILRRRSAAEQPHGGGIDVGKSSGAFNQEARSLSPAKPGS